MTAHPGDDEVKPDDYSGDATDEVGADPAKKKSPPPFDTDEIKESDFTPRPQT